MQPLALEAEALAFGWPQENGARKRRIQSCLPYMLIEWNSFGLRFARRRFRTLEHGLLGESRPSGYLYECCHLQHLHYFGAGSDARSFAMVLVGAVAGWTLRMASVRYIEALFFQVKATALRMLAILGVALVAALQPVMQAVRIDPASMLRAE
jgi:hypothetical protein